ncbi:MAG: gamma-glutamyltransferase [Acidobacteria bacterium]|nr:gamma-glutamyltransferase [Acidobacteriota bacterium]
MNKYVIRFLSWVLFLPLLLNCGWQDRQVYSPQKNESIPAGRIPEEWPIPLDYPPATAPRAMVATSEDLATRVGVEILRGGGNAVDAAVAVAFALLVVHPLAGNLGGGGFAVLRMADGENATIDFRETAPLAATREMYFEEEEEESRISSWSGHMAVGVPGTVAGLWEMRRRFGTLAWEDLIAPAISMAEEGILVPEHLSRNIGRVEKRLSQFPATAAIFLPEGKPPEAGSRWRNLDLAATLRRIAAGGADEFYRGKTADLLVAEMERGGGLITHEDLLAYRTRWREPVEFDYRGYHVISVPPPSSGGLVLGLITGILEGYDLKKMGWHSHAHVHAMAEAMRWGFGARNTFLGDPDFVDIPIDRFLSREMTTRYREEISTERATPSSSVFPQDDGVADRGSTTHFSIVDPKGNAVAFTTTLNGWYGSGVTVAGAGFLLNNEMNDFTTKPGHPNRFGLIQGEANSIAPGKRMLSSMTPTIVLDPDGALFLVTGGAGGSRIISAVFQILSNAIDFDMGVNGAVNSPRFHQQHFPDRLSFEPDGTSDDLIQALERSGHQVEPARRFIGVSPTLLRKDGMWTGTGESHRREGGSARGF